jgi:hypothetical protein
MIKMDHHAWEGIFMIKRNRYDWCFLGIFFICFPNCFVFASDINGDLLASSEMVFDTPTATPTVDCVSDADYSGFMGEDGRVWYSGETYTGHAPVKGGNPHQGFDSTQLPEDHWANTTYYTATPIWIIPANETGFVNVTGEGGYPDRVKVVLRNFRNGFESEELYSPLHQNDGWFYFRINNTIEEKPIRFEINFERYGVPEDEPADYNTWFQDFMSWDWSVYAPLYRYCANETPNPTPGIEDCSVWYRCGIGQQVAPHTRPTWDPTSGVPSFTPTPPPVQSPGCIFEVPTPDYGQYKRIEVAMDLPYDLEERETFYQNIKSMVTETPSIYLEKRYMDNQPTHNPAATPVPYTGLHDVPTPEDHEMWAMILTKADAYTPVPAHNVVVISSGMDGEPCGIHAMEGSTLEIIENINDYLDYATFVIIPVLNPDELAWGFTHVIPYGNGYQDGKIFWEQEWWNRVTTPEPSDPESYALHNLFNDVSADFHIMIHIDFHGDAVPLPDRWLTPIPADNSDSRVNLVTRGDRTAGWNHHPPIYGLTYWKQGESNYGEYARAISNQLTDANQSPYIYAYIRPWEYPTPTPGTCWAKNEMDEEYDNIPLVIEFEFEDGGLLYRQVQTPLPTWFPTEVTPVIENHGGYDVDGYMEQVSQILTYHEPDPAFLHKQFGRDIIRAVYTNYPTPEYVTPATDPSGCGLLMLVISGILILVGPRKK